MTKLSNQEIIDTLEACILDDEDGAGYLFDIMRSGMGDRIKEELSLKPIITGVNPEQYFRVEAERDKLVNDLCAEQRKNSVLEDCMRSTQRWLRGQFPDHIVGRIDDCISEALGAKTKWLPPRRKESWEWEK